MSWYVYIATSENFWSDDWVDNSSSLSWAFAMASSIVLFRSVRKFYHALGILPNHQTAHWSMFNAKTLFYSFSFMRMSISTIAFCIFKANSTFEYGVTNYVFFAELACMFYFSVQIWKIEDIIILITNYEDFIKKSEWEWKIDGKELDWFIVEDFLLFFVQFKLDFEIIFLFLQDCSMIANTSSWMRKLNGCQRCYILF